MLSRFFTILILTIGLTFGAISLAHAHNGNGLADPSAPELDPKVLGSGLAILAGGVILVNERRRKHK
jgi:hypothetical protein